MRKRASLLLAGLVSVWFVAAGSRTVRPTVSVWRPAAKPIADLTQQIAASDSPIPILSVFHGYVRSGNEGSEFSAVQIAQGETGSLFLSVSHTFRRRHTSVWLWSPRGGEPFAVSVIAFDRRPDLSLLKSSHVPAETEAVPIFYPKNPQANSSWPQRGARLTLVGYPDGEGPIWGRSTCDGYEGLSVKLVNDPPWHGDSGGGCFVPETGELLGILRAYDGNRVGYATAAKAIHTFLNHKSDVQHSPGST